MNLSATDVFALAEKRLNWVDGRQVVLAQNIANANTPGYVPKDVAPFADVLARAAGGAWGGTPRAQDVAGAAKSIDGNAVRLDEQMEKVAETDNAHQLAANLVRKYVGLFRTAIGRS